MNIILTGDKHVGKTQLVNDVLDELDRDTGGIRAPKIEEDDRVEIRLKDIGTGEEGTLASTELETGPSVDEFRVNVDTLNRLSKSAIHEAIRQGDLIVIDMIGRMEMHSSTFREGVRDAFRGKEDVIAIVDPDYVHEYEDEGTVIELTEDNYDQVKQQLLEQLRQEDG